MEVKTVSDIFFNAVKKNPDKELFLYKEGGSYKGIKASEMKDRVEKIGNGLISLGLEFEGKVGILSHNRWEWAAADLGIVSIGAADVTIYPTLNAEQIEYIVNNSDMTMIFVENQLQYEKIKSIKANCPALKHIILMDNTEVSDDDSCMTFAKLMESGDAFRSDNPDEFYERNKKITFDTLLTLIYTSGTTGKPKGVMLTHGNLVSNVLNVGEVIDFHGEGNIALSFLPLSHVLERMAGYYTMLYYGAAIAYAEGIETVAQNMAEVHPTIMVSVPRLYEKIHAKIVDAGMSGGSLKRKIFMWSVDVGKQVAAMRVEGKTPGGFLSLKYKIATKLVFNKLKERTGGKLRFFISGGAPLGKEIAEFFLAADLIILEGYGLTETSPVIAVNTLEKMKPGTVGPILPGVEVKIAEDGEILFKGPNLMKGYYKNEEATREAIVDGWFHTGDIGHIDEDGMLVITDRKKELIVTSGGKNIAPQPIENKLKASKYIAQAVLIGDKRKYISALIVPDFEVLGKWAQRNGISFESNRELIENEKVKALIQREVDAANSDFARYEQVKYFALLPNELTQETGELTPTLKVKRRVVNEKYKDIIESLYDR
jgi:long-chain acyl-CoA synthetase